MPELPELEIYCETLTGLLSGREVRDVQVRNVFTVRTADPPLSEAIGRRVVGASRHGKRIVLTLSGPLHLVFHLKLSGRLRWKPPREKIHGGIGCLKLEFEHGSLHMTEASTQKSASLYVVRDLAACPDLDCGVEPFEVSSTKMRELLTAENRQLKSALTDQRLVMKLSDRGIDRLLRR